MSSTSTNTCSGCTSPAATFACTVNGIAVLMCATCASRLLAGEPKSEKIKHQTAFAALNGWRLSDRQFDLVALRDGKNRSRGYITSYGPHSVLDHGEFYYGADKRPVAIVGHPYWSTNGKDCRPADQEPEVIEWATAHGLVLRQCPERNASWHFPGWTVLIVLTRPDTPIVWPPACERRDSEPKAGAK